MSRSERSAEDSMIAVTIDPAGIPLIDFAPFRTGDAATRRAVAGGIADACRAIGFFHLTGHGVADATQAAVFDQSAAFFHLPDEAKARARATPAWYRGWVPAPKADGFSRDTRLFDQYRLQLEWAPDDRPDDPHARIFDAPNRWPDEMPAFRDAVNAYLAAMRTLSAELLRAFALGLGLPETRLDGYFRKPPSQLSLLYHPPLPASAGLDVSNIVSHTDEGPFTILAQGPVAGLEVKRRDGTWIAAPPIPGALTVNVGDMMMWWSNGAFPSNQHRVRNRSGGERFSIPFFVNPDRDVIVGPLPDLPGSAEPRYPAVRVADHLARFYARLERSAGAG